MKFQNIYVIFWFYYSLCPTLPSSFLPSLFLSLSLPPVLSLFLSVLPFKRQAFVKQNPSTFFGIEDVLHSVTSKMETQE